MERCITVSFLLVGGLVRNEAAVQYAGIGDTVHMNCPYKNVNIWQKLETNLILASCENGIPVINSSISNRISISGSCENLKIDNFTSVDVGIYRCYAIRETEQFKSEFNITLQTLNIVEANGSNIIEHIEGDNVTLTCLMNVAHLDSIIFWTAAEQVLASNMSNYVIHRFKMQQTDDTKRFVCTANYSQNSYSVEMQINIINRPRISVISYPSPPNVKVGHKIELRCETESGYNGKSSSVIWSHDGQLLPIKTNTILFRVVKVEDSGKYRCTAENKAGEDSDDIMVIVTFPPVVQNESVIFEGLTRPRTLQCRALGVPDTYLYSAWQHYTYSNQLIRHLEGQINGTLVLPNDYPKNLMYEDSGIYICNVTNNITDEGDNLWQIGKIEVIIAGKPVVTKSHKRIHFGHLNETSSMRIFVFSSSMVSKALWFDTNRHFRGNTTCSAFMTETECFGQNVSVSCYLCDLYFRNTQKEDFQNYTVEIFNSYGKSTFKMSLIWARRPKMPIHIQVVPLNLEVIIKWQAEISEELQTTFFVEYRKRFQLTWNIVSAERKTSVVIDGLQKDTVYYIRLFTRTIVGDSEKTDEMIVKTGTPACSWKIDVITSAAGVVFLIFMYGIKVLVQRHCLNIARNRHNQQQQNIPPVRQGARYDEINSMYYTPASDNVSIHLAAENTLPQTLISALDNDRTFENVPMRNFEIGDSINEIALCYTNPCISSDDNISVRPSSDESYLVPSRKYMNIKMIVTGEQVIDGEEHAQTEEGSSVSSCESSQTYMKSDQKYENLATTSTVEHFYEQCNVETY